MSTTQQIVLGGGCFWCLEAAYQRVEGVTAVVSGYAGGTTENPTYNDLHMEDTGHAEVVQVTFDPSVIDVATILEIFWTLHDPTTLNRQGYDVGPEYRSIILYEGEDQKAAVEKSQDIAVKLWKQPIVTEVKPLTTFYKAEESEQNYFNNHPEQAYCQIIINPKLQKLQHKFAHLLKK